MKKSGLADSPFFVQTTQPQPDKQPSGLIHPQTERNSERKSERTEKRTVALPQSRRTTRYSFEFYEDQITQIKRLKYEAEMAGQKAKLSDFARAAFDAYLNQDKKP